LKCLFNPYNLCFQRLPISIFSSSSAYQQFFLLVLWIREFWNFASFQMCF
jgi:hypothetical protein